MSDFSDRINRYLQHKKISYSSCAKRLKTNTQQISNMANGRNKPNVFLVIKLLAEYKDLSAEWLLRGKGNMLLNKEYNQDSNVDIIHDSNESNEIYMKAEIKSLKDQIDYFKRLYENAIQKKEKD